MSFSNQIQKLKENWLIIVIILVIFFFLSGSSKTLYSYSNSASSINYAGEAAYDELSYNRGISGVIAPNNDFAPDIVERKLIKTSSMSNEIERGDFDAAEQKVMNIVSSSNSFILNQNSNRNGKGLSSYESGNYNIRVETKKYDSVVSQLKDIGEVLNFNENAQDATGRYVNTKADLDAEKTRLARLEQLFDSSVRIEDKVDLTNRIFDQERRIKYLEDQINNLDQRVDYSTINLNLQEKRSAYAKLDLIGFSSLIEALINSFNTLLLFGAIALPWATAFFIFRFIVGIFYKKKKE